MSGNFEKTSLGWQLQLLQMRLSEWYARLFQLPSNGNDQPAPDWSLPEWLPKALFWMVVIPLGLWVLWQLYQLLSPYFRPGGLLWQGQAIAKATQPPGTSLTPAQWLERSRTYAQQGNYREACRALYMAALQQLAERDVVPDEPSRTDGEYLNLLQTLPNPRPYQVLFRTHERLCFSQTPITQATFSQCEQAYRETETP